jgi:hypothetical protein
MKLFYTVCVCLALVACGARLLRAEAMIFVAASL